MDTTDTNDPFHSLHSDLQGSDSIQNQDLNAQQAGQTNPIPQDVANDPFHALHSDINQGTVQTTTQITTQTVAQTNQSQALDPFHSLHQDLNPNVSALYNNGGQTVNTNPINTNNTFNTNPLGNTNPISTFNTNPLGNNNPISTLNNNRFGNNTPLANNTFNNGTNVYNPLGNQGFGNSNYFQGGNSFQNNPYNQGVDQAALYAQHLLASSAKESKPQLAEIIAEGQSDMMELSETLFLRKDRKKVEDESEKAEIGKKIEYLITNIKLSITYYKKKSSNASKSSLFFRLLMTVLAASVTVILGLNAAAVYIKTTFWGFELHFILNAVALVISASLTVISDIMAFYDSDDLRVKYSDTENKLWMLRDNIEYLQLGGDYITLDDVNAIKFEYDKIIEDTNNFFIQTKMDDETASQKIIQGGNTSSVNPSRAGYRGSHAMNNNSFNRN